jgi:SAM-dependent methyltransferase
MIEVVRRWLDERHDQCRAPVLEVGSYDVNGNVRDLFPEPYLGMDMREGPGVDLVANVLDKHYEFTNRFMTIVCVETLEHVTEPWVAVENMARWLAPEGVILVTIPFMLEKHDHPSDYWRMTDSGLWHLFERVGLNIIGVEMRKTHTMGWARKGDHVEVTR